MCRPARLADWPWVLGNFAILRILQKRYSDADALLAEAEREASVRVARQHPEFVSLMLTRAVVLRKLGKKREAAAIAAEFESSAAALARSHTIDLAELKSRAQ